MHFVFYFEVSFIWLAASLIRPGNRNLATYLTRDKTMYVSPEEWSVPFSRHCMQAQLFVLL